MPIHKHLRHRPVSTASSTERDKASICRIPKTATVTATEEEAPLVYYSISPASTSTTTTTTTSGTISPTSESSTCTASLEVMAPDAASISTLDQQLPQREERQQQQQEEMNLSSSHFTNPAVAVVPTSSTCCAPETTNVATATAVHGAAPSPPILDPLQLLANLAAVEREHGTAAPPAIVPSSSSSRAAAPKNIVDESSSSFWAAGKESFYNSEFYNPTIPSYATIAASEAAASTTNTAIREVSIASSVLQLQQSPHGEPCWSLVPAPPPPQRLRQHPLLESSMSFQEDLDEQQHQQQHPFFLSSPQRTEYSPRKLKAKKAKTTTAVRTKRLLPPKKKRAQIVRKSPKSCAKTAALAREASVKPAAARESLRNQGWTKSSSLDNDDDLKLSKTTPTIVASESSTSERAFPKKAAAAERLHEKKDDSLSWKEPKTESSREEEEPAGVALGEGDSLSAHMSGVASRQERSNSPDMTKECLPKQDSSLVKVVGSVSEKEQEDKHEQIDAATNNQGPLVAAVATSNNKKPKADNHVVAKSKRNSNVASIETPNGKLEEEVSELVSEDPGENSPRNRSTLALAVPSDNNSLAVSTKSPKPFRKQPKRETKLDDSPSSPTDSRTKRIPRKKTVANTNRTDETFIMPVTERQAVLSQKKKLGAPKSTRIFRSHGRSMEKPRYATGTEFRRFFERQNHWYAGVIVKTNVVDNENGDPSWQYEMLFDDHLQISFHEHDDAEELDKMLRLALIRPNVRVAIFWPADNAFYKATVLREEESRRRGFHIKYDDGEDEWINLWRHEFQVLDDAAHQPSLRRHTRQLTSSSQEDVPSKRRVSDSTASPEDAAEIDEGVTKGSKVESKKGGTKKSSRRDVEEIEREKSDNDDISIVEQPPRRKRGRPPKKKSNEKNEAVAKGKPSAKRNHDVSDLEDTDVESLKPSPPRKRGRPPKKTRPKDSHNDSDLEASDVESPPRKRGRPPKKSRPKDNHDVSDLETSGGESPPRKSGRPPKKSRPKDNHDVSDLETSGVESPPRKRGRPPKKSRSKDREKKSAESENSVAKRGRGRPPKNRDDGNTRENSKQKTSKGAVNAESDEDSDVSVKSIEFDDSSDDEQTAPSSNKKFDGIEVGWRISVYWPGEDKFFKATVTKQRKGKRGFFIEYDDGDEEWVDLAEEKYRVLSRTPVSKLRDGPEAGDKKYPSLVTRRRSLGSTPPSLGKDEADLSKIRLNTRVGVWWPDDRRYYKATVTRIQPEANWRPYFLEYDDGDEEWIDLRQHKVRILSGAAEDAGASLDKNSLCQDLSKVWIGSRLAVWWPAEEEFFYCNVTRHRDHKRCFYLEYDDGDREWIDLHEHKFYVVKDDLSKKRKP